jgi:S-sulfosulfanyl-L-cysteine sulfohydrolase
MTLDNGKPLEAGRTYRVAGWASVNPQDGKAVAEVFTSYLRSVEDARPKKLNTVVIKGLSSNPGIGG